MLSCNNEHCEYDVLGNPTVYRGRTLTWQGRRLLSLVHNNNYANFTYDANGVRTSKTTHIVNGKTNIDSVSNYIYDGNNLIAEQRNNEWMYFIYGVDGVAGFKYKEKTYLYRKNIQGDITHIYKLLQDKPLELVAEYAYDAWGNCQIVLDNADKIGLINPFRYRSYYFDEETDLYYLQTRYYDPATCRFISADGIKYLDPETLGGLNLYSYCGNNPVMAVDFTGTDFLSFLKNAGKVIGGALLTFLGAVVTFGGLCLSATPILGGTITHIGTAVTVYGGVTIASVFDSQIQADMDAIGWNPFNLDATKAVNSQKVSFYRGMPVIRFSSDFLSSFQVGGIIFFEHGSSKKSLKHESGHGIQEAILGVPRYLIHIALPSVIANLIGRNNNKVNNFYYNFPWEHTADWFGGVERTNGADKHLGGSLEFSIIYFILSIFF